MEAKAVAKNVRIAPRKVRVVMNLIRGKKVADAIAILKFTPKVGSEAIYKVLKSAVANAENNFDMNVDNLYVSSCFVDEGPTMKRIHPRSRGQAFKILKMRFLATRRLPSRRKRRRPQSRSITKSVRAIHSEAWRSSMAQRLVLSAV